MRPAYLLVLTALLNYSCNDKALMEEHTDTKQLQINSLTDAQALLDNIGVMCEMPAFGEISSTDLQVPASGFQIPVATEKNVYIWNPEIFSGKYKCFDYDSPYEQVFYANSILEALVKLQNGSNAAILNPIKGSALFIRAHAFYQVAQIFAKQYDSSTAQTDLGIALSLVVKPEGFSVRSTIQETYDRIILDLKEAGGLLSEYLDPSRKNRPSRAAAFALLSRVYLIAGNYSQAHLYADSCLQLHPALMDYGTLQGSVNPFTANQAEVIYQCRLHSTTDMLSNPECYADEGLFQSYDDDDLRKAFFFMENLPGLPPWPGHSYTGDFFRFAGIAVDEILLIRAECEARAGNTNAALHDLNSLLVKRYKHGTFTPLQAGSAAAALSLVLQERRKELVFRGLRWTDIRRLNKKNENINLSRVYNGNTYTLPANDNRFTLPFPPDVVRLSGIVQNPR